MFQHRPRNKRVVLAIAAVGLVALTSMLGFTASNTVEAAKKVGEGTTTISGYTISGIAYSLNSTNPSNIDSVSFNTSAAATTVKVKLVASGSTWYSCTATNGATATAWSCTTTSPQATSSTADEFRVVASE